MPDDSMAKSLFFIEVALQRSCKALGVNSRSNPLSTHCLNVIPRSRLRKNPQRFPPHAV